MAAGESKGAGRIAVLVDSDLETIIPEIIEDWKLGVESMRKALEKSDYETIRRLGHSMKGTGGTCGFDTVTEMGRKLEESAKAKSPAVIHETLDTLLSFFEQVEVVYK